MNRIFTITAALALLAAGTAGAQETLGSAEPAGPSRPGWVFIPSFGFSETYDDNITLFGRGTADNQNDDFISSFTPHGTVTYYGRHTKASGGYGGSLLNYRTFTLFNRWDQRGELEIRRDENRRLTWYAHANGAMVPSTEAIEFNGIPFSHTGAAMIDGRGGVTYRLSDRNSVTSAIQYQRVSFDRPGELRQFLRGGEAISSIDTFRRKLNGRTGIGADYVYRRSAVRGDADQSITHTVEGSVDYEVTDVWSFSGGVGISYLDATPTSGSQMAPALSATLNRAVRATRLHLGFTQGILPSFGAGGSVLTREAGIGYFTPLFHSRHFYTDHSAVFRDNKPMIESPFQLKLRSIRTMSAIGWAPQPWVRIEGFYSRVTQSSLIAGGRLDRNRLGFRIVTSKPMRMQ